MQYNFGVQKKTDEYSAEEFNYFFGEGIQDIFAQAEKSHDIGLVSSIIKPNIKSSHSSIAMIKPSHGPVATIMTMDSCMNLARRIKKDVSSYRHQQTLFSKLQFIMAHGILTSSPTRNGMQIIATVKDELHEYHCTIDTTESFIKFDTTDIKDDTMLNDIVVVSFSSIHPDASYEIKRTKITTKTIESNGKCLRTQVLRDFNRYYNEHNEEIRVDTTNEETTFALVTDKQESISQVPLELYRTTTVHTPCPSNSEFLMEAYTEEYVDYTDSCRNADKQDMYLRRNNSPSSLFLVASGTKIKIDEEKKGKIFAGELDVKAFVEEMEKEFTFGALKEIDASKQALERKYREVFKSKI